MGPIPPYGPAITQAAQSGDLAQMQATANAARIAIARCGGETLNFGGAQGTGSVEFVACTPDQVADVAAALKTLEDAIAKAEAAQQSS
ncbi:MAG TPA: DUF1843 domain-containing protein [Candidatus Sulfotelmatobacter sp.]|nr:DUF1843 domain-containing protein [Candidatus Sulfotelmatobacter sp.]